MVLEEVSSLSIPVLVRVTLGQWPAGFGSTHLLSHDEDLHTQRCNCGYLSLVNETKVILLSFFDNPEGSSELFTGLHLMILGSKSPIFLQGDLPMCGYPITG